MSVFKKCVIINKKTLSESFETQYYMWITESKTNWNEWGSLWSIIFIECGVANSIKGILCKTHMRDQDALNTEVEY